MTLAASPLVRSASVPARKPPAGRIFLSAQWRALAMVNWAVPPELLKAYVPRGTELDFHAGKTYISIVGFQFLETRLLGLGIPWHKDFEEVNLRFYLVREINGEVRRGVAFIREVVPKWAVATVARWAYNEQYVWLPMRSEMRNYALQNGATHSPEVRRNGHQGGPPQLRYQWRHNGQWCGLAMQCLGDLQPLAPGSHEEYIAEHYWGYSRQRDGGTCEFRVEHPPWKVWQADEAHLQGPVAQFYGPQFAEILSRPPDSAFLADGSLVNVIKPERIC